MRDAIITAALALAIVASFAVQEFIPPLEVADGARVLLAPAFLCYGACVLPFPGMIVLAFVAGFFADFTMLQVVHRVAESTDLDVIQTVTSTVELLPGWSILLFVASGSICQGLRSLVLRGHWWLPPIMSAATTIVYLALQFAVLTMRRFDDGGLFWSEAVAWRILAPALIAAVVTLGLVLGGTLLSGEEGAARRALREY